MEEEGAKQFMTAFEVWAEVLSGQIEVEPDDVFVPGEQRCVHVRDRLLFVHCGVAEGLSDGALYDVFDLMAVDDESEEVVHIPVDAEDGVKGNFGYAVLNEALYGSSDALPYLGAVVSPEDHY